MRSGGPAGQTCPDGGLWRNGIDALVPTTRGEDVQSSASGTVLSEKEALWRQTKQVSSESGGGKRGRGRRGRAPAPKLKTLSPRRQPRLSVLHRSRASLRSTELFSAP